VPYLEVLKQSYGEDEPTRVMAERIITRAATLPATTTTAGWAADLVQTGMAEFMESLFPNSVYPQLRAKGGSFTFGQNGVVTIPYRESTPTVAGAFVAQGSPIPVKQGSFNSLSFTPKKLGVITTMTREAAQHTTPALESLLRQAILDDTAVVLDTTLLDATAASAIRPAGLLNGVTLTGASGATTSLDKFVADATNLIGQLITASSGNLRSPVWLASPGDIIKAQALPTTTGDLPFREELAGGTLFGIPIIQSTSVASAASDTLILMDAADFVTATGDTPMFDVSAQAVLHFAATTPLDITTGSVGTTVKSMFQTDSMAIRMIMDCNWGMRRSGMVKGINTLGWN
jgi:HK97 family phage major capsid protein